VFGPAPDGAHRAVARLHSALRAPGARIGAPLLLTGAAVALAGIAAAIGVATAGVAYLAGAVLASAEPAGGPDAGPSAGALRDLSVAGAGLALGLLVPAAKLPGAVAGGLLLAALSGATKILTGWWAAGRLTTGPLTTGGPASPVGRAGRLRAGLTLMPRGELAVAIGILAALSAPEHGPGTGLAALTAVEVLYTTAAPAAVGHRRPPAWPRWALLTR